MTDFAIAPASLHRLRRRLEAAGPSAAAEILQDAGFATGTALFDHWRERVSTRTGLADPARLDRHWFGPLLDELCVALGWGSLTVTPIGEVALLLEADDWAEAEPASGTQPACHFSCGCFASFLTAQAGQPLAVLEVECRSRGDASCRFLASSSATLATVYDLLAAGQPWHLAFPGESLPA